MTPNRRGHMASYNARRKFLATLVGGAAAAWPLAVRAAAGEDPAHRHYRRLAPVECLPSRVARSRVPRRPEHRLRLCVWRWSAGATRRGRGGARWSPGGRYCDSGTPASFAAKQATTTIPIVMISIGDPVRAGLVPSLARPGGNMSGKSILGPDVGAKRLQILKEAIPTVSRVAFLWNPDNASNALQFEEIQAAAPTLGVTVISVSVSPRIEFETAFAAMMKERPD